MKARLLWSSSGSALGSSIHSRVGTRCSRDEKSPGISIGADLCVRPSFYATRKSLVILPHPNPLPEGEGEEGGDRGPPLRGDGFHCFGAGERLVRLACGHQ